MSPTVRVLLVEDDRAIRESLRDAMLDEGYEACAAIDGMDALQYLRAATVLPNVIVIDLMMPRMSGPELAAELKRDADLARIPLVVISADAQGRTKAEALGAARWFQKPLSLQLLFEAVAGLAEKVPGRSRPERARV
jgi:two-component system chemotaxis response regulator CheY